MFFEYALEPAVISSWDRARFFLDAFGPWKGRLLAEYPRRWKRMVYEGLSACSDVERKKIEVKLAQLGGRVFSGRASAPYDSTSPWLENAVHEHAREAFWAIIARGVSREPHVLDDDSVDDRTERWRVDSGRLVPREPAALVDALRVLLLASRRVIIIDPHFRAEQDDKTQPLISLCRAIAGRGSVEVHCSDESRSHAECMRHAERALPRILPADVVVTIHCWRSRTSGPRLHNRYVMTEVGGIQLGDGVELGEPGQQDRFSILDQESHAVLWEHYLGASPMFDAGGLPRAFKRRS